MDDLNGNRRWFKRSEQDGRLACFDGLGNMVRKEPNDPRSGERGVNSRVIRVVIGTSGVGAKRSLAKADVRKVHA
jgi:hypothetical protein